MAEPGDCNEKNAIFIAAALDDYGLTADEFRVFCRIARRGDCTEGTKGIAEGCKLSERQVRYAIRVLDACGFISIKERVGFTSIIKCQSQKRWVKPENYESVKAQVLTSDPKRKPAHKTPAQAATPAQDAGGVLHTVQGGTAHGAAKGNPIKVIPLKEYSSTDVEEAQSATPTPEPAQEVNLSKGRREPTKQPPDERVSHPAILAVQELHSKKHLPPKEIWDLLIRSLGDDPDRVLLRQCHELWFSLGYKPINYAWATEWYVFGMPERKPTARGSPQSKVAAVIENNLLVSDSWLKKHEGMNEQPRPN